MRCVDGCLDCVRSYDPVAELCDGVDNDCSGGVDDGEPQVMGSQPPAYAATANDFSYPASMAAGERAEVWVQFTNLGSELWRSNEVWLGSRVANLENQPSPLYPEGEWPSWDVAATLDRDVAPGEEALFSFLIEAPPDQGRELVDGFRLIDPAGEMMACPQPAIEVELQVTAGDDEAGRSGRVEMTSASDLVGGCSTGLRAPQPLLFLAMFLIATRRRTRRTTAKRGNS